MATVNSNSSAAQPTQPSNAAVAGIYKTVADRVSVVLSSLGIRAEPPLGVKRPVYPANLRKLALADILELRDAVLIYRSLLVDELCRCRGLEIPAKEQVDLLKARLMKNSTETNADRRKAAVESDNNYVNTNAVFVGYKSVRVALDAQLEQIDAELERIRDECFYKQKQYTPAVSSTPRAVAPVPPTTPAPVTVAVEEAKKMPEIKMLRPVPIMRPVHANRSKPETP